MNEISTTSYARCEYVHNAPRAAAHCGGGGSLSWDTVGVFFAHIRITTHPQFLKETFLKEYL